VVEHVVDGPFEARRCPGDPVRLEVALESNTWGAVLRAIDGVRYQLVERDGCASIDRGSVARRLDQVVDERRQLVDRSHRRAEDVWAPCVRQGRTGQELDVRAVRGRRRPELMGGVGDQLLLRALRFLERSEHGVEVLGQAAELVPSGNGDPPVEITRRGYVAHRFGEAANRAQYRPRSEAAEQ